MPHIRTRASDRSRPVRRSLLLLLAALPLLGACTRDLESTGTCSILCPDQDMQVQQLVIEPVSFDTTVAMFPLRGEESQLLAAWEDGGIDTRVFYRFDATPRRYLPLGSDSVPITQLYDAYLRLRLDTLTSVLPEGTTLEVYDVDGDTPDADLEVLPTRFTADRLFGTFTPTLPLTDDTVRVELDTDRVLASLLANGRIRVGVRAVAPEGRVLVKVAPLDAVLAIDPTPEDDDLGVIFNSPLSRTPTDDPTLRESLTSFHYVVQGSPPLAAGTMAAGGLPGQRALLRFDIPPQILDSTNIVRATLVLTQVPVPDAAPDDSALLVPMPVQASDAVTDVIQSILLAGHPGGGGLESRVIDTLRLASVGAGTRELELQALLAAWRSSTTLRPQRAIVLAIQNEGLTPAELRFYSREAPDGLRPRLRLTYIPRVNLGIP